MDWVAVQTGALAELVGASLYTILINPARRYGTRRGRKLARLEQKLKGLDRALGAADAQLRGQLGTLHSVIATKAQHDRESMLSELENYFASAPLESLVRQALAIRLLSGERAPTAQRILGPLSMSMRIHAPTAHALHPELASTVSSLIALAAHDVVDALQLESADVTDECFQRALQDNCMWQLQSLERSLDILARPGTRVADLRAFPERYRSAVVTAFSKIPTPHWDGEPRAPIDKVYVAPRFVAVGDPLPSDLTTTFGMTSRGRAAIRKRTRGPFEDEPESDQSASAEDEILMGLYGDLGKLRRALGFPAADRYPLAAPFGEESSPRHHTLGDGTGILPIHNYRSSARLLSESSARAVVLGDPGAGKTAFASFLIHQLATRRRQLGGRERLPFLISLREYRRYLLQGTAGGSGFTFAEFIADRCAHIYQVRPPEGAIELILLDGEALVIFDGLDEILDVRERRETAERIEIFAQMYPNVLILATARRNGYENAELSSDMFAIYSILPFIGNDVAAYVRSWFSLDESVPPGERREQRETFLPSVRGLDPRLYTNPLTLALLCNLFKASGYAPLPKSRAEIYEKCSLMLYHRWDQRRGIGDVDFERDFLPVIAFAASRIYADPSLSSGFTERKLVGLCLEYLVPRKFDEVEEARRYAQSLINHCVGRAWVFSSVSTSEEDEELFHFTHRTFLEFFAALHLVRSNSSADALAEAVLPWIATNERRLVCQMAFEIKTRHLNDAAEEFCETIMQSLSAMTGSEVSQSLEWLAEEAAIVPIGQSTLRRVVRAILALDAPSRQSSILHLVQARGENRRVIDQTVAAFITESRETQDYSALRQVIDVFIRERSGAESKGWRDLARRLEARR